MRRFLLAALLASSANAFTLVQPTTRADTALSATMDRRSVMAGLAASIVTTTMTPGVASAGPASTFFWDDQIENVREEAQMHTGGKIDLNAAFVGDYKEFRGMFPHAAGKIASNGPYANVSNTYLMHRFKCFAN